MLTRRSLASTLLIRAGAVTGFDIAIDYGQLVVQRAHLQHPGLIWTDQHVAQGFAWRDGIVAFGVPDRDATCRVNVRTALEHPYAPTHATLWAIAVPFDATEDGLLVGSVTDTRPFRISPGRYQLTFEALPRPGPIPDDAFTLNLAFRREAHPVFAILKQGSLRSPRVLTRTAQAA